MTRGQGSKLRDGLTAVAEWEAEHGALTPEELDAERWRVGVSSLGSEQDDALFYDADAPEQIIDL